MTRQLRSKALAYSIVERYFDHDLEKWPQADRVRVLVAALDNELNGRQAVKEAVHDAARDVLDEWKTKRAKKNRNPPTCG